MSRQVKNAKDIVTGDLVYFVSHAKATYLGDGSTVEDTVNVMKRDIKNSNGPFTHGYSENSAILKDSGSIATNSYAVAIGADNSFGNIDNIPNGDKLEYATAAGYASHAEGAAHAIGDYSHAEGGGNTDLSSLGFKIVSTAEGECSHAEGTHTHAKAGSSHAEGNRSRAYGIASHAEGRESLAEGLASHAEGFNTKTGGTAVQNNREVGNSTDSGAYAHAEGNATIAKGIGSHSEGRKTIAIGNAAHAEGQDTVAEGYRSHAEGKSTRAIGRSSHAEGEYTITNNVAEHAAGQYNISTSSTNKSKATHFSIGIGTSDTNRKNAFEVKQNGDIYAYDYKLATGCINVTHEELVNLRTNKKLIPGQQYRITDYQTVSNKKDTIADGRRFDIIVVADDESTLNENARAIHHEGCNDFEGENLAAWELKYTLTNDDYLYHWGNSGDRIESKVEELYNEYKILSINGNKIEYGYDVDDSYGEYTIDKSKTYSILGNKYYRTIENESYYVSVNYSVGGDLYYYNNHENIEPSFIMTDKLFTFIGENYYQLDKYRNHYVSTEYDSNSYICEYNYEFWQEYEILSINGDKIEYGYDGDPYGEYTIDKSKTYNINSNEYYKVIEDDYYCPVNYSVDDHVYYFNEYMSEYCEITNIVNTPSTTGTIYYMKDEHNNECSYDFNCIKFLKGTDYIYTFSDGCYDNHINPYITNILSLDLNSITFGKDCYSNSFGNNCYGNSFGDKCYRNTFGTGCKSNSFSDNCYNNSFSDNCHHNSFDNNCYRNTFGAGCYSNSFGYGCHTNSLGYGCYSNSLGYGCYHNSFGYGCYHNSFVTSCYRNTFGTGCYYNSFFRYCDSNSFGEICHHNSFGDYCCCNSFGASCKYNSFRKSASTTETLLNYCWYNHFDDGCGYNVIWNSEQPTSSNKLQNINVVRGVSGTSSTYNYINIVEKNANHEIKVAKNSNGVIKVYCEADLIE